MTLFSWMDWKLISIIHLLSQWKLGILECLKSNFTVDICTGVSCVLQTQHLLSQWQPRILECLKLNFTVDICTSVSCVLQTQHLLSQWKLRILECLKSNFTVDIWTSVMFYKLSVVLLWYIIHNFESKCVFNLTIMHVSKTCPRLYANLPMQLGCKSE